MTMNRDILAGQSAKSTSLPSLGRSGDGRLMASLEQMIEPMMVVLSLAFSVEYFQGEIPPHYMLLALAMFALTYPGHNRLTSTTLAMSVKIFAGWTLLAGLVLVFLWASRFIQYFDADALRLWLLITPFAVLGGHLLFRQALPFLKVMEGAPRRVVVAGANPQGMELARRMLASPYHHVDFLGFFDDRARGRLDDGGDYLLLGRIDELPEYVKRQQVNTIYLSLPMASQPRILRVLSGLRDTTASTYFVPDMFVTDLIQARMDTVGGMPVVSVCETPFRGWNGVLKRVSDVVLSVLILLLLSPAMLAIALAVKLTSPGPVIFKQRRYGLDGDEIHVYKFRSMTVCEDDGEIRQAQKNDSRLTSIGGFLRKSSLDELPQFFNVLRGQMSIVGPRPHAVAHNEVYRKVIKGYMIRHKVKPGITGWAQVNGYRGETDTVDKMQKRVEYDLEYLRNWSLRFDIYIILKTVWVLAGRKNAY
ncbi:MAG: undecaprenyl-phosphate glucose phosphotransferase [Candidatus Nitricoxidivorans perseverans]|uniref:Undecaprenyl-phosphate glucose phosphotransferase n=1 Tax=Candidatus Nitricoxidivorans perseverans TaxID=2975601 RepID=A0AA49IWH2_9PROT|nr:MAG: undecaprenyl-phosphate glucose phosphotransferase [Candidatus Nitricoxidivorans perseverans]